jgi:flavin-dependent dehydrogenase
MKGATMTRKFRGAPIVDTETVGPAAASGALWIGEAARLANSATGEGIGYAMQSATIAAEAIERFPDRVLAAQYERALRRAFTPSRETHRHRLSRLAGAVSLAAKRRGARRDRRDRLDFALGPCL